jgi:uncharacterized membrane protein
MDAEHAARLDQANALRGAVLGALVAIAFLQWGVEGLIVTAPAAAVFAAAAGTVSGTVTEP